MMKTLLDGKSVLVTGGTGSLGQAVVRRLLTGELGTPSQITVFSRDEAKQHDMRLSYLHRREATDDVIYRNFRELLRFRIGDMRDHVSVLQAVRGADVVVHAAALKQVPTCEYFPTEAVRTNLLGTENLIRAISNRASSVGRVVGISTDKACKPINVMGMTKAVMERMLVQANVECPRTVFSCVRYGNVLYTRGSAAPLFVEQIRAEKPITITDPKMTRYLLTLDEAIGLVEFALINARQGDLFIRKSPACRVDTLANALKRLFDSEVPVKVIGVRHGEKIHETLASFQEYARAEDMGDFLRVPMDDRDLNYDSYTAKGQRDRGEAEDYTSANTEQLNVKQTAAKLEDVAEIQDARRLHAAGRSRPRK